MKFAYMSLQDGLSGKTDCHWLVVPVKDAVELERTFGELLSNAGRREKLGQNALKAVQENLGAVDRTVEMVINGIKDSGVYVAPLQKREL